MFRTIFVSIIVLFISTCKAETKVSAFLLSHKATMFPVEICELNLDSILELKNQKKEIAKKKLTAIVLAATLGPFGMHRLFLGTDYKVPVIYSITLGAFGILPLIDIAAIITTRDMNLYDNNSKIIMWVK